MQDLDALQLKIIGDVSKATDALDGLIGKLEALNHSLHLNNVNFLTQQLDSIAASSKSVDARNLKATASSLDSLNKAALKASDGFKALGNAESATANNSNGNIYGGMIDALESIQNVSLPSFSGLTELATGLERLVKINPNKIADISNALQGIRKSTSKGGLNAVDDMANKVAEVIAMLNKEGNAVNFLADELGNIHVANIDAPIKSVVDEFRKAGNEADFVVDASGNIARVAREAESAVNGVAQGFELAVRNAAPLSTNVTQSVEELARGFQLAVRESAGLTEAVEQVSGSVENGFVNDWSNSIQNLVDVWQGLEPVVDSTAHLVYDSMNQMFTTAPMDEFSRHLHDVLLNITKYGEIISGMEQHPITMDAEGYKRAAKELHDARIEWDDFQEEVKEHIKFADVDMSSLDEVSKRLTELIDQKREYDRIISKMESGEVVVNSGMLAQAYKGRNNTAAEIQKIEESLGKVNNKIKETNDNSINLLANLVAFSHELVNISQFLGHLADQGIKVLKFAFKPLDHVVKEYKEKIESLGNAFKNLAQKGKKHLDNLSRFWKRTMKTFTFMLVRKAITAVLSEVTAAVQSLAKWSKEFGTIFNDSMSNITSDFSYMARAIVGAFEPLINAIAPLLDALADAFANLAAKVGEFFAAMTGQGYYMKAKKQVVDYSDSVEKAQKAQKNLIAGLDDLNVITTPTATESGMDDVAEQWEKIDVSDKMKDIADKVKDFASKLFDPIKKAWDRAGQHVIDGWKFMTGELKKLGASVARDFWKVWQEPVTQKIFENIFHTIGYILEGVGYLARNFRLAWDENDRGLHILENIAALIENITGHVKNMARDFREWAKELDFSPLLESFKNFLKDIYPLIDFLGKLLEEIFRTVILEHWRWLIEDGLPHLLKTIGMIAKAFNFDKILADLTPVLDAFEKMRQNIETGIVDAIGNLGLRIAEFANSEDFSHFCENVVWLMNQITAERVEKLFTALGTAILDIAEALMKFVGSDDFKDFIQKLLDWYDSKSAQDIADGLKNIAKAIALFKFAEFAGKGLSMFLKFLTLLQSSGFGKLLGKIGTLLLKGVKNIGKFLSTNIASLMPSWVTGIFTKLGAVLKSVGAVLLKGALIVAIVTAIAFVINNWDKIEPVLAKIADKLFEGIGYALGKLAHFVGEQIVGAFQKIGDYFGEQIEECGGDVILGFLRGVALGLWNIGKWIFEHVVKPFIKGFKDGFDSHSPARVMIPIGMDVIAGFLGGIVDAIKGIGLWLWNNVISPIIGAFADAGKWLWEKGKELVGGLLDGINSMKESIAEKWEEFKTNASETWGGIKKDALIAWDNIKKEVKKKVEKFREVIEQKWGEFQENATTAWENIKKDAGEKWDDIKKDITDIAEKTRGDLEKKWGEVKKNAVDAWTQVKDDANTWWTRIKDTIVGFAKGIKNDLYDWWEKVKTDANNAWTNFCEDASTMWNNIKDTIVGKAGEIFGDLQQKWTDIKSDAEGWWEEINNSAATWWSNISGTIAGALDGLRTTLGEIWNGIWSDAETVWDNIKTSLGTIAGQIGDTVASAIDGVKRLGNEVANTAKTTVNNAVSTVKNTASNVVNGAKNAVSGRRTDEDNKNAQTRANNVQKQLESSFLSIRDSINKIAEGGKKIFDNNVLTEIQNKLGSFRDYLNRNLSNITSSAGRKQLNSMLEATNSMSEMIENAKRGSFRAGQSTTTGFSQGLYNKMATAESAAKTFVRTIITDVENMLGIGSPSKVFAKIGGFCVEGFNNGIEDNEKSTVSTMNEWAKSIEDFQIPMLDIESALPKDATLDLAANVDYSGNMAFEQADIEESVRSGVAEAIGGLVLPYLNSIAESSRETANKKFGITSREAFDAVRTEARNYNVRTGREAFAY